MSLREDILALLKSDDEGLSEGQISKALKLPRHLGKRVQQALSELQDSGLVSRNSRHRYSSAQKSSAKSGAVHAILSVKSSGNGFARVENGDKEFFIPERHLGWALSGDLVEIRRLPARPGPPARGRGQGGRDNASHEVAAVSRVIRRGRDQWVGELSRKGKETFLTLRQGELEIDLDLEKVPEEVPTGDWVVASAPGLDLDGKDPAPARFISRLGGADTPNLDTLILIKKAGLKEEFSAETLSEASHLPHEPAASDLEGRMDLRDEIVFTIDGADAKDFDDAVSLTRTDRGWSLGVHIADVSHYVRPGSAIDKEAYERGTSVYLPDRVLPMLPEGLSNGLCSLKPDVPRLTQSAFMDFDAQGNMQSWHFASSVIRSARRFTYEEVEAWLDRREGLTERERPALGKVLDGMRELALKRRQRREERGALDFNFPETKVDLDEKGNPLRLWRRSRLFSHQLIEEFMLAANEAVARELKKQGIPVLYRIHESPDEERLAETMAILGRMKLGAPRGAAVSPKDLQKILKRSEGKKEERLVHTLLLRSLRLARYDPNQDIHFGLALEDYCHFTSPIRRYPDLLVHRGLRAMLLRQGGTAVKADLGNLAEKGLHCSEMERKAEGCERECVKAKQVRYLEKHLGETFLATITSVTAFGVFAEIQEFPAEGLLPMGLLDDDYYVFDSQWMRLEGRRTGRTFSIGDSVSIQVKRADWKTLQVDFVLAHE